MKHMRLLLSLMFGSFLLLSTVACTHTYIEPGYVGVQVYLHGSSKGVDHEVVGPGKYYVGINEKMYLFPTFLQNYNFTRSANEGKAVDESFTFQDNQGMSIGSDVGVSYSFLPNKVDEVFVKFHQGPDEITSVFLRSVIRDSFNRSASKREIQDIYGSGKAAFINEVQNDVKTQAELYGIHIERIFLINELRLPDNITRALNEKTEATQRAMKAENELRVTQAEAAKQVAEAEGYAKALVVKGKAESEYNHQVAASITPTLIDKMKAEKWDGKLPQVQGSGTPFLNIGSK